LINYIAFAGDKGNRSSFFQVPSLVPAVVLGTDNRLEMKSKIIFKNSPVFKILRSACGPITALIGDKM
jgi:hypothetical protein